MANPETIIKTAIFNNVLEPLEQLNVLWYQNNNTGGRGKLRWGKDGAADILLTYCGRSVHAEVKVPGKVARGNQVRELEKHRQAGGYSCVVWSVADMRFHLDAVKRGADSPRREQWLGLG